MADTLLLDRDAWDLTIDASGNIAMASIPYSILQDIASVARLFLGESWYNVTAGIPYFGQILGQTQPVQVLKAQIVKAALSVPGVLAAQVFLSTITERKVTGQIQVTTAQGAAVVAF